APGEGALAPQSARDGAGGLRRDARGPRDHPPGARPVLRVRGLAGRSGPEASRLRRGSSPAPDGFDATGGAAPAPAEAAGSRGAIPRVAEVPARAVGAP